MKIKNKIFVILIFSIILLSILTVKSQAATGATILNGKATSNAGYNNYSTYGSTVNSYLYKNADGTLTRVEYLEDERKILIEVYDSSFKLKSTNTITNSLSLFGGFYSGSKYNFIVSGQVNSNEDDTLAVYRIEKYSKDWKKLGSVDLKKANTYIPFDAGSCRMSESNGTLYIETCHEMYATEDGLHHQANVGIEVDIDKMQITYSRTGVSYYETGYVSHSFNQFIQAENDFSYTVDHGDAYPREILLAKRKKGATYIDSSAALITAGGEIGNNVTGMSVGGFELSSNNCLIVGNSINQESQNWASNVTRNIFLSIVPKNNISSKTVKTIWITNYKEDGKNIVKTPQLVKINNDKFAIMWEETTEDNGGLIKIQLIDGSGKKIGDTISIGGRLSDCQPIVYNNNLIWYTAFGYKKVVMFSVDVSNDSAFTKSNGTNIVSLKDKLQHFAYSLNLTSGTIMLTKFDDKISDVDLSSLNLPVWLGITDIASGCFTDSKNLKSIKWPSTLENISYQAFYNCKNLTGTLTIPKSVKNVGYYAFVNTGLSGLKFESNDVKAEYIISKDDELFEGESIKAPIQGLNLVPEIESGKEYIKINSDGTITIKASVITSNYATIRYKDQNGKAVAFQRILLLGKKGDINHDGKINSKDAREALKAYVGIRTLYDTEKKVADVNGDGNVNAKDARQILLYYIGKIKTF